MKADQATLLEIMDRHHGYGSLWMDALREAYALGAEGQRRAILRAAKRQQKWCARKPKHPIDVILDTPLVKV